MPVPQLNIPSFVKLFTPPNYRLPKWLAFVQSLCSGLTWRKDVWDGYRNGDAQPLYSFGATYGIDDTVVWNFATYQSLKSGNIGNQPNVSPLMWFPRNPSTIGATERAKYSCNYLPLTYQLNRYFGTTFRQPPYPAPYGGSGTFSDIYLTTDALVNVSFLVATKEDGSDSVSAVGSTGYVSATETFGSASSYRYTIHIPLAVFNSLGASDPIRTSVVTRFANLYNPSGTQFSIVTY